jgi:hypothetical protein
MALRSGATLESGGGMSRILVFGTLAAMALALVLGLTGPTVAQGSSKTRPTSTTRSSRPGTDREEVELEVLGSEQADWNFRTVNDPIYREGASVNSVMFERRSARQVRQVDFLPSGQVQDVEVRGSMVPPTVIRIQGRQVRLPAPVKP